MQNVAAIETIGRPAGDSGSLSGLVLQEQARPIPASGQPGFKNYSFRLLDSLSETDAGLFRRMYKSGIFELMGTDGAFEFGLKLILLGIEQVIKEQEK